MLNHMMLCLGGSEIMPCIKIVKPLVFFFYIFSGKVTRMK